MGGRCNTLQKDKHAYKSLVREAEVKIHLERLRFRWEDNNKIDSEEDMYWIHLAQNTLQLRTSFSERQGIY